jgi:hypothetical protein
MTTRECVHHLKNGDRVYWEENEERDDTLGTVNQDKSRIEWDDGQITLFTDALIGCVYLVNPLNPDPKRHNSLNLS